MEPIVDLVVALHVRRLVGDNPAGDEMPAQLPALHAAAGVSEADGQAADAITALCDGVAFDFCMEEAAEGTAGGVDFRVDGLGRVELDPWPLGAASARRPRDRVRGGRLPGTSRAGHRAVRDRSGLISRRRYRRRTARVNE